MILYTLLHPPIFFYLKILKQYRVKWGNWPPYSLFSKISLKWYDFEKLFTELKLEEFLGRQNDNNNNKQNLMGLS